MPSRREALGLPLAELVATGLERLEASGEYEERSPVDATYNCVAFAAGDTGHYWSPQAVSGFWWPADALMRDTVGGVMAALACVGYVECEDPTFEDGYEKVAIFAKDEQPKHAARQDPESRLWLSKLGKEYDIAHANLDDVGGEQYGEPVKYMRRERPNAPELPRMRRSASSET